jgi:uncharacterized protein (DUF952 family)
MAIYKILSDDQWKEAQLAGGFHGAPIDLADGFIHFSTTEQVEETARKHFKGQNDLLLATIDEALLGDALRYEPSRGGQLFPHLYGPMPLSAIIHLVPLPMASDGYHRFEGLLI